MPRSIKKSPPGQFSLMPVLIVMLVSHDCRLATTNPTQPNRTQPIPACALFEFCCASAKEFKTDFLARLCRANSSLPKWLLCGGSSSAALGSGVGFWNCRVTTWIGQDSDLTQAQGINKKKKGFIPKYVRVAKEKFLLIFLMHIAAHSLRPAIFLENFCTTFHSNEPKPETKPKPMTCLLCSALPVADWVSYTYLFWRQDSSPCSVVGGVAKLFNSCSYKIIYECLS